MKPLLFTLLAKRLHHVIIEVSNAVESEYKSLQLGRKTGNTEGKVKCLSDAFTKSKLEINNVAYYANLINNTLQMP